jgi:microcystin-dependent protein
MSDQPSSRGTEPFIGEIAMVGFNFAPTGWALCNGQLLPISQNVALFSLLGTTYGGDGRTSFALPDFRGRVALHAGDGPGLTPRPLGQTGGEENVTLTAREMPGHSHALAAYKGPADSGLPDDAYCSVVNDPNQGTIFSAYHNQQNVLMNPGAIQPAGNNQPHTNLQPFLAVYFIIALVGIFPSRP